ncbi:aminotransferase [Coccidioides immitis RS]|uniref:Aminotransferase n=4 Tax=Coccidioides immitis TaxID=5501 RepID=A0A0E1RWJ9_COCIM|nr:aminotransferase [Coccidioides immitis RS]KMP07355.1 ydfD [Coccidioides immitis RMSCC 2394]KMU72193.1 hypothetical protein CISG_00502 [Coccidioides immitis RMSCC 3703]KMU82434.1 ydfD [Coccidioides immitis H538.4]TPX19328.1 hypothetical protein DIZ76_017117 [Coccidioides immitis]EAS32153.1 aminotransferase [Coccidioides immitis RS]
MADEPKPPINLFRGWPNPSLHPTSALQAAATTVLLNPALSTPALGYGPDEGDPGLRAEIAKWLTEFYSPNDPITADRICISGGASQNLACVLQVFSDAEYTRRVWMVEPTYYLACRIFDDAGFANRLRAVPEDPEGIDIGFLERELEKCEDGTGPFEPNSKSPRPWRKIYKHIVYAVPTFSNPSGRIMSTRRREQLVRLARKFDALVITDDVYDFLQWKSDSPSAAEHPRKAVAPRLVDIDRVLDGGPKDAFGNVVSNGSFSKLIGAGCRVGWAEGTAKFAYGVSQTGSSRSGGAPSQLTSTYVRELLSTSFLPDYIDNTLRPVYARRHRIMLTAIRDNLTEPGVRLVKESNKFSGGYFVWLELPAGIKASHLASKAQEEESLLIGAGTMFRVEGDTSNQESRHNLERYVRLCFAYEEEQNLTKGVERLASLIRRYMRTLET